MRTLVIGFRGGVGRAALALLARHRHAAAVRARAGELVLVDAAPEPAISPPEPARVLPPLRIESRGELERLIRDQRAHAVIQLAPIDTDVCIEACRNAGADLLTTGIALDRLGCDPIAAAQRLLDPDGPGSQLLGSGMNPGVVNALVEPAIAALGRRAGVGATDAELGVASIYVTEEDTTRAEPPPDPDAFAVGWSPRECLDEVVGAFSRIAQDGRIASLGHRPHRRVYAVRCGDRTIDAMAVPHEEVVTISRRHPGAEVAFFYRLPDAAMRALAAHPERGARDWATDMLVPPRAAALAGHERVGVVVTSRRHGALWLGFETSADEARAYGTNATELQVAAGTLAGWGALGTRSGAHAVEDLDMDAYLDQVVRLLGPPREVYAPADRPRPLDARPVEPSGGDGTTGG